MNPVSGAGGAGGAGGLQQIIAMRQQVIDRSEALQDLRRGVDTNPAANGIAEVGAGFGIGPVQTTASAPDVTGGFADRLKDAVENVNSAQTRASEISAAYERGEVTDVAQVMLARQESGVAFEATLQVRNKLLSAYQDIMRMGV